MRVAKFFAVSTCVWSALSLAGAAPASAQAYGNTTSSLTRANGVNNNSNFTYANDCNVGAKACGSGSQSSSTGSSLTTIGYSTSSGASNLGGSKAFAEATGQSNVPGVTAAWSSNASADTRWWDTFTVQSSSGLNNGASVTINLSMAFKSSSTGGFNPSDWQTRGAFAFGGPDGPAAVFAQAGYQGTSANGLYTGTITAIVGIPFQLWGVTQVTVTGENGSPATRDVFAEVETDFNVDVAGLVPPPRAFAFSAFAFSAFSTFDADVSDPDAVNDLFITTASGHDYATKPNISTVPEPSTFALMFAGVAALAVASRRRATRNPHALVEG